MAGSTSISWLEARYAAMHATLAQGSPFTTEMIWSKIVTALMLRNPVTTSGAAPVRLKVLWALLEVINREPKSQGRPPVAIVNLRSLNPAGVSRSQFFPQCLLASGRAARGVLSLTGTVPSPMHTNLCDSVEHEASLLRMNLL